MPAIQCVHAPDCDFITDADLQSADAIKLLEMHEKAKHAHTRSHKQQTCASRNAKPFAAQTSARADLARIGSTSKQDGASTLQLRS